ncbi:MAG: S16 family serine protease, partial [bacterium]
KGFLIPRELEKHGLTKGQVDFQEGVLLGIIQEYTREAGVRNLERQIAKVLRKIVTSVVRKKSEETTLVTRDDLPHYLGAPKYHISLAEEEDQVGTTTGLAWTEFGGDTLPIEVTILQGRGNLTITGQLGEVMQESAKAAMSFVRSRASEWGLEEKFYRKIDVHIHVPEGAVPKDGPSAGVTMATALCSALTKTPVRRDIAMTGEITLRGKVLAIGGLKEKLLAARRAGIKEVIAPFENKKDYEEIKNEVPNDLKVNFVKYADEAIAIALTKPLDKKKKIKLMKKNGPEPLKYSPPSDDPPQMYA